LPPIAGAMKVFFLPRWFPLPEDPLWGLFVLNHARALRGRAGVHVVYVDGTDDCTLAGQPVFAVVGDVPVLYCRYLRSQRPLAGRVLNPLRMIAAWFRAWRMATQRWGRPDLIHVHILTRLGLWAWLLKKVYGIPYVITEHWSRYLPQNMYFTGVLRRMVTRCVVRGAGAVMPVSHHLRRAMEGFRLHNSLYRVVPNVVDTTLFCAPPAVPPGTPFTFVHVSTFDDRAKNISGLLRVVSELSLRRNDFVLRLVGDGADRAAMEELAARLSPGSLQIRFEGALEPEEVAEVLRSSHMMVLFSHYENLPVVILEALCCGVPVIATRVGGIPEVVNDSNGYLVEPGDEQELLHTMERILNTGILPFNPEVIAREAVNRFSEAVVAQRIMEVYREVTGKGDHD